MTLGGVCGATSLNFMPRERSQTGTQRHKKVNENVRINTKNRAETSQTKKRSNRNTMIKYNESQTPQINEFDNERRNKYNLDLNEMNNNNNQKEKHLNSKKTNFKQKRKDLISLGSESIVGNKLENEMSLDIAPVISKIKRNSHTFGNRNALLPKLPNANDKTALSMPLHYDYNTNGLKDRVHTNETSNLNVNNAGGGDGLTFINYETADNATDSEENEINSLKDSDNDNDNDIRLKSPPNIIKTTSLNDTHSGININISTNENDNDNEIENENGISMIAAINELNNNNNNSHNININANDADADREIDLNGNITLLQGSKGSLDDSELDGFNGSELGGLSLPVAAVAAEIENESKLQVTTHTDALQFEISVPVSEAEAEAEAVTETETEIELDRNININNYNIGNDNESIITDITEINNLNNMNNVLTQLHAGDSHITEITTNINNQSNGSNSNSSNNSNGNVYVGMTVMHENESMDVFDSHHTQTHTHTHTQSNIKKNETIKGTNIIQFGRDKSASSKSSDLPSDFGIESSGDENENEDESDSNISNSQKSKHKQKNKHKNKQKHKNKSKKTTNKEEISEFQLQDNEFEQENENEFKNENDINETQIQIQTQIIAEMMQQQKHSFSTNMNSKKNQMYKSKKTTQLQYGTMLNAQRPSYEVILLPNSNINNHNNNIVCACVCVCISKIM